jgi:omega-amidase
MQDLQIASIQTDLHWEDISANLAMLEEKIWKIEKAVDLIILPEMFNTGFSMNAKQFAEPVNGQTMKWMKQIAAQSKAVITGSIMIKVDGKSYNRLIWMQPDGKYDFYDKRHTFKLTGEHQVYESGNKPLIKTLNGWKINLIICYDLRFPVWCRNQASIVNGEWIFNYDIMVCVANWPSNRGYAWNTLLKSRAIENSSYVIGVNRIGKDGRGFNHEGGSLICSPLEVLNDAGSDDTFQIFSLIYGQLGDYRIKYPFLQDSDKFELKI